MDTDTITYEICHDCATAVFYCDDSHLDADTAGMVEGFLSLVGLVSTEEIYTPDGYWSCECCEHVQIGEAFVVTQN